MLTSLYYTGKTHVPLDLCPIVSHLADMYLEPYLKDACDHAIKEAFKANSAFFNELKRTLFLPPSSSEIPDRNF